MIKKLLFEGKELHISHHYLPILIHGSDGNGASLFSISVMADLYAQGAKLLFICGYHMARDEFEQQTDSATSAILVESTYDFAEAKNKQVIFVPREKIELAAELVESLADMSERVVFIKNFELFDHAVFLQFNGASRLILSGDIDKCTYANDIRNKKWLSQIFFSAPRSLSVKLPKLQKYHGYFKSNNIEGTVTLAQ